ncbi:MAG: glucose sorbosone dehydrogenase [Acidimicrobiales bacterium]|nr:glucose sorbosone dehydrogenase [Acidimicrobiales bacterium]RZV45195.1 MAG: glucose sorbosone dehydrogenase [Acidimicrobiales bacterium]
MFALLVVSCGDDTQVPPQAEVALPAVTTTVLHDNLVGPTQFLIDGDTFIVALINGDENGKAGQVVRVDRATDERTVLVENLDKPTGVALLDGELWIMERDRLTRGTVDEVGNSTRSVVIDQLPNNGRSQGTLTVTPQGTLLFNTSGRKRGAVVAEGSGRIFEVDPATNEISEVASGFKHAYARAFIGDTLWSVEMSDGTFDGTPATDELVAVQPGADHGWPHCVGNRRVVVEFGGSSSKCLTTPGSQAVFGPSATPTSIVESPFAEGQMLAALWRENRIVAVAVDPVGELQSPVELIGGLSSPQHLVVPPLGADADGPVVYLTEFGTGSILAVRSS